MTFDPTPTATPARSLIAAIDEPDAPRRATPRPTPPRHGPAPAATRPGLRRELEPAAASGGPGLPPRTTGRARCCSRAAASLLVVLAGGASCCGAVAAAAQGPLPPADRAVADLVVALRRAGRPVAPGMTLTELERRLGGTRGGAAYLATLRPPATARPTAPRRPTSARAFRRELGAGLGWRGRLRAWWALPPQLR